MEKENVCLKLMMIIQKCSLCIVIHREILVSKNIPLVLNKILESVIKYINDITFNAKCENLFQIFCENKTAGQIALFSCLGDLEKNNKTHLDMKMKMHCLVKFIVILKHIFSKRFNV